MRKSQDTARFLIGQTLTSVRRDQGLSMSEVIRKNPQLDQGLFASAEKGLIIEEAVLRKVITAYHINEADKRHIDAQFEIAFSPARPAGVHMTHRRRELGHRPRL